MLLAPLASDLYSAGLRRINISLDTLDRDRFKTIARFDKFDEVIAGLQAAVAVGFQPIKLNTVVMKGTSTTMKFVHLLNLPGTNPFTFDFLNTCRLAK